MVIETVRDLQEALSQHDPDLRIRIPVRLRDEDGYESLEHRDVLRLIRSPKIAERALLIEPCPDQGP